ncbi:MAG: DUF4345 domain-containing protein [Chloroflexi bacterium]|jgi:hypothetical protein|nr:DUF4345 domain-containing protein [Chloroflexota bacterium]
MVLLVLKIVAAVGTLLTGIVSLVWPRSIIGFTGLEPVGGRGVTEIRAVFGGAFIGLGAVCLALGEPAYRTLGVMYLAIAAVRAVSMVTDKSVVQSNIISLLVELAFGVALVL